MKWISLLIVTLALASTGHAERIRPMGLGFGAPQISQDPTGNNVIANPKQGELVFWDTSGAGTGGDFYGFDGTNWTKLLATSGSSGLYGTAITAGATSCVWTSTTASWSNFAAVSACSAPTVGQNASAPSTKVPGITFSSLAAGDYQVVVTGTFTAETSTACAFRISDGTNSSSWVLQSAGSAVNSYAPTLVGTFSYGSPQSNLTFQIQTYRTSGTNNCKVANDQSAVQQLEFRVIKL